MDGRKPRWRESGQQRTSISTDSARAALVELARGGRTQELPDEVVRRCNYQRLLDRARRVVHDDAARNRHLLVQAAYGVDALRAPGWIPRRRPVRLARPDRAERSARAPARAAADGGRGADRGRRNLVETNGRVGLPRPLRQRIPKDQRGAARDPPVTERAIDDLPAHYRLVFLMREVEERTVDRQDLQQLGLRPDRP